MAVQMTVLCETPEQVARTMEALGRAGAGIALEGQTISLGIATIDDDEEDTSE